MFQRFIYTLTLYLLTPFVVYRLAARGIKYHGYFARWRERFGFFADPGIRDSIWIHAVSLGEVNAAIPLIEALMRRYSDSQFVITTVTPTGSDRVLRLFGDRVFHVYLPYDLTTAVKRFLDRVRPRLAVIMETEIWPNLFMTCAERDISIVIANARLSEKSLRGYWPIQPLARRAIRCASFVAAQSTSDYERLSRLGADASRLAIVGNLKFDLAVPAGVRERGAAFRVTAGGARPVWIAASTHEGEEMIVLKAHADVLRRFPDALLLLAPRHPERFKPVATACRAFGFHTATRSEDGGADPACQCFVVDSMGELIEFYAAADVAFVGGSLVPVGGHNLLEPAALARPVIVGPQTFNFAEVTEDLIAAGAVRRIAEGEELGPAVVRLLARDVERRSMGEAARAVMERERGAVDRTMAIVEKVLAQAGQREAGRRAK
ncbi:lipid IV(A) 3-deoxy-D-manno-octulosonic acid transferase [Dokdonella fugitiva]|uniref:3-deoxy-D-manno-octulosonic acid transferase n=1 Tax=Dokdonella fugitiva TaxID=328517 RepID=A0A4R2I141_9GAMM|nr:lipid IV(A) 3-deoxy-D-manno-octulosonic acid transferase [Dokdonella fugitiva]MBA8884674.1 3-deoxy-D-manno-octulosonic-acid transferase [Dokdonella fugitiva]TCO37743.1 3-deoxy-D-manno-octulosonic-acid transferase [Dokdonella fugitiva]